jgi:O-antigen/teichoic acid export membrane protein
MKKIEKWVSFLQKEKNLLSIGASNIISNGISSIFWLYLASILNSDGYGLLGFYLSIVGITGALSLIGSANTLTVLVSKGEKIQATVFSMILLSSIVVGFVTYLIFQNTSMSLYPIGYVIFSSILFELLGKKLFVNFFMYSISQRILMVIFSLLFYQYLGIDGIILGYTFSFLPFAILMIKGYRESKIDFSILRNRSKIILNNYVEHLLKIISLNIDKIIILPVLGSSILGHYLLGFQIFILLLIIPSAVFQYILPYDAIKKKNQKLKKITVLFSVVIAIISISVAPSLLPIIFPKFIDSIIIIQIMSIAIIPKTISTIYTSELLGNNKNKTVMLGTLTSTIILVGGILTIGIFWGYIGISIAFVLSKIGEVIFLYIKKNNEVKLNRN